jgi:hypothetical protein
MEVTGLADQDLPSTLRLDRIYKDKLKEKRAVATESKIEGGNDAQDQKGSVEDGGAAGNGDQEMANDKRREDNAKDGRRTIRDKGLSGIDNQRNCSR